MSKFSPVCPSGLLEGLVSLDLAGDYHLWLAHDVLDKPKQYQELKSELKERYPDLVILMDNSLVELGHPLPANDLLQAYDLVDASYLILPDALCDREWTVEHSREATKELRNIKWDVSLAAVVQGKDDMDVMRCIVQYTGINPCMICIPRVVTKVCGTRGRAIQESYKTMFSRPIHLLGFSDDLMDDMSCARMPQVMGIDSSEPIRQALKGNLVDLVFNKQAGPRGDYWDTKKDEIAKAQWEMMAYNLYMIRKWISVKQPSV